MGNSSTFLSPTLLICETDMSQAKAVLCLLQRASCWPRARCGAKTGWAWGDGESSHRSIAEATVLAQSLGLASQLVSHSCTQAGPSGPQDACASGLVARQPQLLILLPMGEGGPLCLTHLGNTKSRMCTPKGLKKLGCLPKGAQSNTQTPATPQRIHACRETHSGTLHNSDALD